MHYCFCLVCFKVFYSPSYSLIALILPPLSLIPWSLSQGFLFFSFSFVCASKVVPWPSLLPCSLTYPPSASPVLPEHLCARQAREQWQSPDRHRLHDLHLFFSSLFLLFWLELQFSHSLTFHSLPPDLHAYSVNSCVCLHSFHFTAFTFFLYI